MAVQKALILSIDDAEALIAMEAVLELFEATDEALLDAIGEIDPDASWERVEAKLKRWKTILANAHHFTGIPNGGRHSGE